MLHQVAQGTWIEIESTDPKEIERRIARFNERYKNVGGTVTHEACRGAMSIEEADSTSKKIAEYVKNNPL